MENLDRRRSVLPTRIMSRLAVWPRKMFCAALELRNETAFLAYKSDAEL